METNELMPCPFCGGKAKHVYFRFTETHSVWCRYCEAESYEFDTEEEAIEAWNTRAERTCKNVADNYDGMGFVCSECTRAVPEDEYDHEVDKYCSCCGARVVQDAD